MNRMKRKWTINTLEKSLSVWDHQFGLSLDALVLEMCDWSCVSVDAKALEMDAQYCT